MFLKFQPFFLIAETPIHPGSGGSLSIVDLPIQREKHTNFPKIEPSGLKGCIREVFESLEKNKKKISLKGKEIQINKDNISLVFGPDSQGDEESYAGAIGFTDARILLFPVKSLKGIFAWITCPQVLERFKKDMKIAGKDKKLPNGFEKIESGKIASKDIVIQDDLIVLEEFTFKVKDDSNIKDVAKWFARYIFPNNSYKYWRKKLENNLVILSDDEFRDFVTNSTEVIIRTKIDNDTGTVEKGGLWTEEYLPQDSILYSIAMASGIKVKKDEDKDCFSEAKNSEEEAELVLEYFRNGVGKVIQIGGNQTIGKGLTRIEFLKEEKDAKE